MALIQPFVRSLLRDPTITLLIYPTTIRNLRAPVAWPGARGSNGKAARR
jgi:hypothetical protein